MTISTFDLVIRNMLSVHERRGIFRIQNFGLFMALEAFPLRDMTIPLNHINVTLLTGHPPFNVPPVIEAPTLDLDISFRFEKCNLLQHKRCIPPLLLGLLGRNGR
jgi:hypothetical protein